MGKTKLSEERLKALLEGREKAAKQVNAKGVKRRRRKPDEVASRSIAIRNFCLECMGYLSPEVEQCTDIGCWLYPYRLFNLNADWDKEVQNDH